MNRGLAKVVSTVPPGAGAAVMGTAILSIGAALVSFLICVATQGLAVLGATVATATGYRWPGCG
ncbi:hypothetical protein [Actinocatenispora rupis]|uniref:Uncharacterized protein n=1 Tax=Actinocatenispora rupis TaxID=519421 RepID=A0A8J3J5Z4_9ACTN|nr:hypothetical protein [Actinocatenispora rupis]GID10719.1 hypothetical protein Aru02nite_16080 [Actinocatenispora rupis]